MGEIYNLPIKDLTVDVLISNCVINLIKDKLKEYKETFRVLKDVGRIIVSDLVTDVKFQMKSVKASKNGQNALQELWKNKIT